MRAPRAAGRIRANSGSKRARRPAPETPTYSSAAESETARYWPRSRPEAWVRSKIHWSGESTVATKGRDRTGRSKTTCRLTMGARPRASSPSTSTPAWGGSRAAASSWGAARTTASASRRSPATRTARRRRRPGSIALTRARSRRSQPASASARAAGSPCSSAREVRAQPMSAAPDSWSSPVWKTLVARARDASRAGRLRVGRAIRSQKPSTTAAGWRCSASHSPKLRSSRAGSARSRAARRRAARATRSRSRRPRCP